MYVYIYVTIIITLSLIIYYMKTCVCGNEKFHVCENVTLRSCKYNIILIK